MDVVKNSTKRRAEGEEGYHVKKSKVIYGTCLSEMEAFQ